MPEHLDRVWYRLTASQRRKIANRIRIAMAARNIADNMMIILTVLAMPAASHPSRNAGHQTPTSKRQPML